MWSGRPHRLQAAARARARTSSRLQPSLPRRSLLLLGILAVLAAAEDGGSLSWTHDLHVEDSSAGVAPAEALVDGSRASCVALPVDPASPFGAGRSWVIMDLGQEAAVNSVGLLVGSSSLPGGVAAAITLIHSLADLTAGGLHNGSVTACGDELQLQPAGAWLQADCNATGRYLSVSAAGAVELCSIEVAYAASSISGGSSSGGTEASSGLSAGAIAGICVGSAAGAALLLGLGAALCKLRRRLQVQHAAAAKDKASSGKDDGKPSEDSDGAMERGDGPPDYSSQRGSEAPVRPTASLASTASGPPASAGTSIGRRGTLGSLTSPFAAFAGSVGSRSEGGSEAAATDVSRLPRAFGTVSPSEVRLIDVIGEGSFACVWRAEWQGTIVAAKLFNYGGSAAATASRQQASVLRSLRAEASLLSALRHPNVCTFLGACEEPPYLLTEFCARKSVDGLLAAGLKDAKAAQRLSWARLLRMALDAGHGMAFLHSRGVVHRDLKSPNLLVDSHWNVKVGDFNLSRFCCSAEDTAQAKASTLLLQNPRWLSPEAMTSSGALTPAADVWSFGVVLHELATWRLPFCELNAYQIIAAVQAAVAADGQRSLLRAGCLAPPAADALPAGPLPCWGEYVGLMAACLSPRPEDRPTFEAVVQRLGSMLEAVQGAASSAPADAPSQGSATAVRALRMPSRSPAYSAALSAMQQRQASMQRQSASAASAATGSTSSAGSPRPGGAGGPQQPGGLPAAQPAAIGGVAG